MCSQATASPSKLLSREDCVSTASSRQMLSSVFRVLKSLVLCPFESDGGKFKRGSVASTANFFVGNQNNIRGICE